MESDLSSRSCAQEKPSLAVVRRIADREGVDPVDLTPPLHSAVDPEALDSLFRAGAAGPAETAESAETDGQVTFRYCGYEVRLRSDGEVSVGEP